VVYRTIRARRYRGNGRLLWARGKILRLPHSSSIASREKQRVLPVTRFRVRLGLDAITAVAGTNRRLVGCRESKRSRDRFVGKRRCRRTRRCPPTGTEVFGFQNLVFCYRTVDDLNGPVHGWTGETSFTTNKQIPETLWPCSRDDSIRPPRNVSGKKKSTLCAAPRTRRRWSAKPASAKRLPAKIKPSCRSRVQNEIIRTARYDCGSFSLSLLLLLRRGPCACVRKHVRIVYDVFVDQKVRRPDRFVYAASRDTLYTHVPVIYARRGQANFIRPDV